MTRLGIEPRVPGPLANTLPTKPMRCFNTNKFCTLNKWSREVRKYFWKSLEGLSKNETLKTEKILNGSVYPAIFKIFSFDSRKFKRIITVVLLSVSGCSTITKFIIIIIKSRWQHRFLSPAFLPPPLSLSLYLSIYLSTRSYNPSLPAGPPYYIHSCCPANTGTFMHRGP